MSFLGIGEEIAKPIEAASNLYTTDKARIEAETNYAKVLQEPVLEQTKLNEVYASSNSIFLAGGLPLLSWSCGFLILLYYAPQILIATYVWGRYCIENGIVSAFPIKSDDILNLVYLIFGFGGYHLINKKISN